MATKTYLNLPYQTSSNPEKQRDAFHEFDLYVPESGAPRKGEIPPLICFVHGGAWRSEDKADHAVLAHNLVALTGYPVVLPNYRLTPRQPSDEEPTLLHPAHAEDILAFLTFLLTWSGPEGYDSAPYDPTRLYLIGHSCSAHMLASIILDSATPSLTPTAQLLKSIRGVIMSEGIYDLDILLQSFPDYRQMFVADAFEDRGSYEQFSVAKMKDREGGGLIRWLIIHSTGDTLVDLAQSQVMFDHLSLFVDKGTAVRSKVSKNWEELDGDHNEILAEGKYARIVGDFILADGDVSIF